MSASIWVTRSRLTQQVASVVCRDQPCTGTEGLLGRLRPSRSAMEESWVTGPKKVRMSSMTIASSPTRKPRRYYATVRLAMTPLEIRRDGIITIDAGGMIQSHAQPGPRPGASWIYRRRSDRAQRQDAHARPHRGGASMATCSGIWARASRTIGIGVRLAAERRDGMTFPMALAVSEMPWTPRRMSRASSMI